MKQSIGLNQFQDAFKNMGREDQFSRAGLRVLFEHLEQYEDETGEEIELDIIALCCDYTESSIADILRDHCLESLEELQDQTTVIMVDDETVIYGAF